MKFIFLLLLAILTGIAIPRKIEQTNINSSNTEKSEAIYIISNGWHEELCIPDRKQWLVAGWGDEAFYPSTPWLSEMRIHRLLSALFLPTPAVIRIHFLATPPTGKGTTSLQVSEQDLEEINRFLNESFLVNGRGRIPLPAELIDPAYEKSRFYKARGIYSALYTCNNWTAQALNQGGIITGIWTPLPFLGIKRKL